MTLPHDEPHEHDLGLAHDLPTLLNRRRALGLLSAGGLAAALAACTGRGSTPGPAATTASPTGAAPTTTSPTGATPAVVPTDTVPEETAGPFPADGSNGIDVLGESGVVRQDIRASFGGSDTVAEGVPVTVAMTVIDLNGGEIAPLAGAAVYVWHCDREGRYSMYDDAVRAENYLRGVQVADAQGRLSFTSVFPGAYPGRWPHVHFEVYRDEAAATTSSDKLRTSQLAIPQDVCDAVYATQGYETSAVNFPRTPIDQDMVFADGFSLQMARATGSIDEGCTLSLTVAV